MQLQVQNNRLIRLSPKPIRQPGDRNQQSSEGYDNISDGFLITKPNSESSIRQAIAAQKLRFSMVACPPFRHAKYYYLWRQ